MLQLPNKPKNRKHVEMKDINNILQATTTSRKIAIKFGKRHSDIIRVIENKIKNLSEEFSQLNIKLSSYVDKKGGKRKEYLLSHDASMIITLGFRAASKSSQSRVYFIWHSATRKIKIGFTTNLKKRFNTLNRMNAKYLVLLGSIAGNRTTERKLHECFKKYRIEGTEWFDLPSVFKILFEDKNLTVDTLDTDIIKLMVEVL